MMSGKTNMIFITSDEDLVLEISSKKSSNTHIIPLNDYDENNIINLSLNQLSEPVYIFCFHFFFNGVFYLELN